MDAELTPTELEMAAVAVDRQLDDESLASLTLYGREVAVQLEANANRLERELEQEGQLSGNDALRLEISRDLAAWYWADHEGFAGWLLDVAWNTGLHVAHGPVMDRLGWLGVRVTTDVVVADAGGNG